MTVPSTEERLANHTLSLLRDTGRSTEADTISQWLDAKGWARVDLDLLESLSNLLAHRSSLDDIAAQLGVEPPRQSKQPEVNDPCAPDFHRHARSQPPMDVAPAVDLDAPLEPDIIEAFAPFVTGLPGQRALVEQVNTLFMARSQAEFKMALTTLFVEYLHFDEAQIEETLRLRSTTVVQNLTMIAQHREFTVCLAQLAYPLRYPSTLEKVFRLHPDGLVFTYAPEFDTSAVAYRVRSGSGYEIQQRILVGRGQSHDPEDNLLTWAWRFAGLRPRFEDDPRSFAARVIERMSTSCATIDRHWTSSAFTTIIPPGLSWEVSWEWYQRAFVQAPRRGWFWGLTRVLRDVFPIVTRSWRLALDSFQLDHVPPAHEAWSRSGSWMIHGRLDLVHSCAHHSRPISIQIGIPIGTPDCKFLIDGQWYQFAPRLGSDYRIYAHASLSKNNDTEATAMEDDIVFIDLASEDEGDQDQNEDLLATATTIGPHRSAAANPSERELVSEFPPDAAADDSDSEYERSTEPCAHGAAIGLLLDLAVRRKLAAFARHLQRVAGEFESADPERAIQMTLRRLDQSDGPLYLASRSFLSSALRPLGKSPSISRHITIDNMNPGDVELPPAWSCPDFSRFLPPGSWYPIASARLTPTGGLSLPHQSGQAFRLAAAGGTAFECNPRWGQRAESHSWWWIAKPLSRLAALAPGTIPHVVGEELALYTLSLSTMTHHGNQLRAWISPRPLAALQTPRWLTLRATIPALLEADPAHQPELLVTPGADLNPGMPWLRAPRSLWSEGIDHEHPLGRVRKLFKAMAEEAERDLDSDKRVRQGLKDGTLLSSEHIAELERDRAFWSRAAEAHQWRLFCCPDGSQGQVVATNLQAVRTRSGIVLCWHATLVIRRDEPMSLPYAVVLEDGRIIDDIRMLPLEDTPFRAEGMDPTSDMPLLIIEDPQAHGSEVWWSGTDGAPLMKASQAQSLVTLLFGPQPRVVGPVWQFQRRARDGEGIPHGRTAPGSSLRHQLWWFLCNPEAWSKIAAQDPLWLNGEPPWSDPLRDVLIASRPLPPDVLDDPQRWLPKDFDPTVSFNLRRISGFNHPARKAWSCVCGETRGPERAFDHCGICNTAVGHRRIAAPRLEYHVFSRGIVVLHPWRKIEAAAVLGLTQEEFEDRLATQSVSELLAELRHVCDQDPRQRLMARLLADRENQRQLGLGLWALDRALDRESDLWGYLTVDLARLPFLPCEAMPLWLPFGAPQTVKSPLAHAYRHLSDCLVRYHQITVLGTHWLVDIALRSVQSATDALFGDPDKKATGEPQNLAALISRLWPLSRPPRLRSLLPGAIQLFGLSIAFDDTTSTQTICLPSVRRPPERLIWPARDLPPKDLDEPDCALGEDDLEDEQAHEFEVLVEPSRTSTPVLGVVLPDGPQWIPPYPVTAGDWANPNTWRRRSALSRIIDDLLPDFLMLLLAIPRPVLDRYHFGSCTELACHLFCSLGVDSDPTELVTLITRRGRRLPQRYVAAVEFMLGLLEDTFVGDGEKLSIARAALAEFWACWWRVPITPEYPLGWRWIAPDGPTPQAGQRYMPAFSSRAWLTASTSVAIRYPVRWFDQMGFEPHNWASALRSFAGYSAELESTHRPNVSEACTPDTPHAEASRADIIAELRAVESIIQVGDLGSATFPDASPLNIQTPLARPESFVVETVPPDEGAPATPTEICLLDIPLAQWLTRGR